MDRILGPKTMAIVVVVSLLAAVLYVAHTSRQVAKAMPVQPAETEIRSAHAARISAAIDQAERSLNGTENSEDADE